MALDRAASLARDLRGTVTADPASLERAGRDGSHLVGRPIAVAAPEDVDDVVALVRWARREHVPLVARGGGTSLDGESVPQEGAVVVDLSGWNTVREIAPEEGWARVEPGVVNRALQEALRPLGRFFPPNPGSWNQSTIGGHVGTNASGPRSFRYGAMRAWVRGLDVVLGNAERVRLGTRAAKRSAGPDLVGMFVGSEGTLGIVTEVLVRIAPLPTVRRGIVAALPNGASLARIAGTLAQASGTGLSAIEYLDPECARALAEGRDTGWPIGSALLLLEIEADGPRDSEERLERVTRVLRTVDVTEPFREYEDADELWTERGQSGVVLDERFGHRVREDIAVPLSAIDTLVAELDRIARAEEVRLLLFGHLGEGSLHPNFAVDPAGAAADRIRDAVYAASLALRGTISAEHGIGRLKRPYLERELGPSAVRLLHALKQACDPDGILNPGKLYPPPPVEADGRSSPSPSGSVDARVPPE